MFKFASLIKSIINKISSTRQNDLDRYITSKNPSTPAEVDHWAKEYLRKNSAQGWSI